MAFGYDGSVRIKADLNHSNFDKGLSAMTGKVQSFEKTLSKIVGMVGLAFGTAALVNFTKEAVNAASALNDAWMGLESIVAGQGKSFNKAKSFVNDYISDGLVPLENAVTAYKNLAARGYSTEQIEKTLTALKDAAAFGRQASYSLGEAVSSATEGLKNENSILVDNAGVTKNVAKMWDDYAKSIGTTANNLTQEQKIQAEVNGILEETRFQTGDAAKLVNTYSGQIALLGYNFQNLKVQVGNALIPIAKAVLPGINAIISALTKLATVFSQVTALLFGKSAEVKATSGIASSAASAATATDKLAGATEGAGSASKQAAKDMKGVLAGFDELNILANRASDSVGGAGSGLGDIGSRADLEIPSFESEIEDANQLEEAFSSLGELFIKTLDDMLAAMPTFKQALLDFAANFNDFNQKLYDAFTFPGVLDRVKQLGVELADAFNGLVDAIDWELWGRTMGAGLNLALNFLTSFIYEFDWINLGNKLAEFVNGLVYEIDWYEFGRLLWAKFKIGLEAFAGFLLGLDMPALAQAASDIIKGFFNSMQESIANIDWAGIGRQIAEFLNNIDWIGVINSIVGAFKEMVGAGLELIGGFISNADPDTLLVAAALLGSKLLGKIVSTVIAPVAKEIGGNLIKEIAAAITGGETSGLLSSIGKMFGNVFLGAKTAVSDFGAKISDVFAIASSSAYSLSDAIQMVFGPGSIIAGAAAIVGGALLAVNNFLEMLKNGFNWVNEALMLLGVAIAAVGAVILGVPVTVAAAIAAIVAAVATAVVIIKEHAIEIGEFFANVGTFIYENFIVPVGEFFAELGEKISEFASNAVSAMHGFFEGLPQWFDETIIQPLSEGWDKFWSDLAKWASDTWSNVQAAWESAGSWFDENVVQPVSQFFSDMWDSITQWASDTWDNIVQAFQDAGSWFEEHVTGPIGDAFNAAVEVVKGAINGVVGAVEGMINAAIKGVNWLISQLNKIRFDVPDWVPAIGGKSFGFNIPSVSEVQLPRLANGAVIPPNQQFAAILGDQRSGKNLEAPAGLIRQMVQEGIQAAGGVGRSNGNMTIIMEIDGHEFGRASYKYGTAEQQRVGVRLVEAGT